ncbi:hypothetical protein M0R45_028908 [Rubus argutus]|uniref:Gamma-interferon-inducible lysosomal thiol reductase n=1 Tax=Rubus argutus TaxID=59490 RepID=A0AAW1W961_RUBAR
MGLSKLFLFFFILFFSIRSLSYAAETVSVTLYYETLCPYCADFIVNHLANIFQNGLISIVNLRMVPWGNAWLNSDGSFACQHGSDECLLNTIEACTMTIYPNVNRHFTGYGNQIETNYAKETAQLNPPHRFVPWLVVNNKPLAEDYENFMAYICKAYKGKPLEACRSIRFKTESTGQEKSVPRVCLAEQGRNSTS